RRVDVGREIDFAPSCRRLPSCSRPSRTLRAAKTPGPSGILDRRCARRLWNAQVGTAGWPSRSNNRMVVWFRPPPGGLRGLSGPRGSERPAVIRRIAAFVGVTLSSVGLERFAQLIAMEREDLVAEIVDQFEHRQRHLGRPKAGDLDGS